MRYVCSCCGGGQRGVMDLVKNLPDTLFALPDEERQARAIVTDDLCSLDDEHFFVRAILPVPIIGTKDVFAFGVWGSVSQENFKTYATEFDNPAPAFGPFFSWLNSALGPYPNTFNLKSSLVFQPNNQRPVMRLDPSDHPLAVEQRTGITVDKLSEIYAAWGHEIVL